MDIDIILCYAINNLHIFNIKQAIFFNECIPCDQIIQI